MRRIHGLVQSGCGPLRRCGRHHDGRTPRGFAPHGQPVRYPVAHPWPHSHRCDECRCVRDRRSDRDESSACCRCWCSTRRWPRAVSGPMNCGSRRPTWRSASRSLRPRSRTPSSPVTLSQKAGLLRYGPRHRPGVHPTCAKDEVLGESWPAGFAADPAHRQPRVSFRCPGSAPRKALCPRSRRWPTRHDGPGRGNERAHGRWGTRPGGGDPAGDNPRAHGPGTIGRHRGRTAPRDRGEQDAREHIDETPHRPRRLGRSRRPPGPEDLPARRPGRSVAVVGTSAVAFVLTIFAARLVDLQLLNRSGRADAGRDRPDGGGEPAGPARDASTTRT